jgi:hypothetical protein
MAPTPSLRDALSHAEAKLSTALGGECRITVRHDSGADLLAAVADIESRMFRNELQYKLDELEARSRKPGFTVLFFTLNDVPFAFDLGYSDEEQGAYFGDSAATLIERKGVGAVLTALDAAYAHEAGYRCVKLVTEEQDQAGRRLADYWARYGYRVTEVDADANVSMRLDLTAENVKNLYDKYIAQ